jgi:hypothetical protein
VFHTAGESNEAGEISAALVRVFGEYRGSVLV